MPVEPPRPGSPVGWNCAAVARVSDLAGQLVRAAVLADRQAGASWAQIGAGLGISAEAARSRFGRSRRAAPAGQGG
ncbi:helix-turn-helix domain-containing protein [Streptomyces sp. AcE210]|nr:helix-turn-helix domain-containing protein [Streptomyces sp. AcE210]